MAGFAPRVALRTAVGQAFCVVFGLALLAGCGSSSPSLPRGTVRIPLTVRGTTVSGLALRPLVYVRVGKGPRIPVLLDTGSIGLTVFRAGLNLGHGGGVALTKRPVIAVYGGSTVERGLFASAKVMIDGVSTQRPVRIGVIDSIRCRAHPPFRCGTDVSPVSGIYGTLGVSLRTDERLPENPLRELARGYSAGWSISLGTPHPALTLGVPPPAHPSVVISIPRERDNTAIGFDDIAGEVCWRLQAMQRCLPTLFDSGSPNMYWFAPPPTGIGPQQPMVPAGTLVTASLPTAPTDPFWSFIAGGDFSRSGIYVMPPYVRPALMREPVHVNTGVQAFYAFTITYDARHGRIYLVPAQDAIDRRISVPVTLMTASRVCLQGQQALNRAMAAVGHQHPRNLRSREEQSAMSLRTWGTLSLSIDQRLAELRMPTQDRRALAGAIAADTAGSDLQIATSKHLTSYDSPEAFLLAMRHFWAHYYAIEGGWILNMDRLGIGGCAV